MRTSVRASLVAKEVIGLRPSFGSFGGECELKRESLVRHSGRGASAERFGKAVRGDTDEQAVSVQRPGRCRARPCWTVCPRLVYFCGQ